MPLDCRMNLGYEHRFTDPQVRALRALRDAGGEIARDRAGYPARGANFTVSPRTMIALADAGLVIMDPMRGCEGSARLKQTGRDLLAAIDAEAARRSLAPSIARSAE